MGKKCIYENCGKQSIFNIKLENKVFMSGT